MTTTYTINDLRSIAKKVLHQMNSRILLLDGPMGSGKTTLIKQLVNAMGSDDEVSSPTFSLVNEYHTDLGKVYHFDMYRLNDESEAFDIGFEDYLYSGNYCFIEWPDKVKALLPQDADRLYLYINQDGSRSLKLSHQLNLTL